MRRVLFRRSRFQIYSYPAMMYVGWVFAFVAADYIAHLVELDATNVLFAMLVLSVPALLGARLFFVLMHWHVYAKEPSRIWRHWEGGGALMGGLLMMLPISIPLLMALQIAFWRFWDVAVIAILVGYPFGRVGCLLNGCCGGRASDGRVSLYLPDYNGVWKRRIPTQLLEMLLVIVLLAGGLFLLSFEPVPGSIFLFALGGYGAGRFVLEPTREEQDMFRGVRINQLISVILVVAAILTSIIQLGCFR